MKVSELIISMSTSDQLVVGVMVVLLVPVVPNTLPGRTVELER